MKKQVKKVTIQKGFIKKLNTTKIKAVKGGGISAWSE